MMSVGNPQRRPPVTIHQIPNTLSLDAFWMPFTANRQFKAEPRLIASASGMHYTTIDGRKVIDGSAGLWCVNAGHGRKEIAAAVERQLMNLDFAPSFQMGHPLAFDFAERLAEIAPVGLDRIFFTNSGSESVDTALKIALVYQRVAGQPTRTRLLGRERGYHVVGFGGMSIGWSISTARKPSPPSSSNRCRARPACCRRRRAICSACASCATSTAFS